MSLIPVQFKQAAKKLVDQSLGSSLLPQRGFQFRFDGNTGLPIVAEWEKGIEAGRIVSREKETNLQVWLGGLAYATGTKTNEIEIRQLSAAIINQVYHNLGLVGEV